MAPLGINSWSYTTHLSQRGGAMYSGSKASFFCSCRCPVAYRHYDVAAAVAFGKEVGTRMSLMLDTVQSGCSKCGFGEPPAWR